LGPAYVAVPRPARRLALIEGMCTLARKERVGELDTEKMEASLEATENDFEWFASRGVTDSARALSRRVSSGRAAEIVGCSKAEFVDKLDQYRIPYFTETPDELEAQVEAVRAALGKQT